MPKVVPYCWKPRRCSMIPLRSMTTLSAEVREPGGISERVFGNVYKPAAFNKTDWILDSF